MCVKERKERDKIEMREKILNSAHQLFLDRGFEEVSIRNIADAIEYSPATIYLYFKDKNEIFYALHGEAFKMFNQHMARLVDIREPFQRLIEMGEEYLQFFNQHPKYYEIMFLTESPMDCEENQDKWQEGQRALGFLESILKDCQTQGRFANMDTQVLAFSIWSYMHGMCALVLRQRVRCYPEEDRERIRTQSFENFKLMISKL
jgi:AcrR family transcriptional regulator